LTIYGGSGFYRAFDGVAGVILNAGRVELRPAYLLVAIMPNTIDFDRSLTDG
jgi:hypothetical protein